MNAHVFGYGSLAALAGAHPATLREHRRAWTVAMDNSADVCGYKRYLAAGGRRPPYVAFLDVIADAAAPGVHGVCIPADAGRLRALDERERNYRRIDVSALVDGVDGGPVWTYVGLPAARERAHAARASSSLVVARAYLETATAALLALGLPAVEPPDIPVLDLIREDVP